MKSGVRHPIFCMRIQMSKSHEKRKALQADAHRASAQLYATQSHVLSAPLRFVDNLFKKARFSATLSTQVTGRRLLHLHDGVNYIDVQESRIFHHHASTTRVCTFRNTSLTAQGCSGSIVLSPICGPFLPLRGPGARAGSSSHCIQEDWSRCPLYP